MQDPFFMNTSTDQTTAKPPVDAPNARLGIVGGGQLALYLCEAAQRLGIEVIVFADHEDSPALAVANQSLVGASDNEALLSQFVASSDFVTFDKEDISDATLAHLVEAEQQGQIIIRPGVDTMRLLKDKGLQKAWLVEHNLPTLAFRTLADDSTSLASLHAEFGPELVQKARCGGYDGRGVQMLNADSAAPLWEMPSIIEPFLADCHEISVITARAADGEMMSFPPVSMAFDAELNSVNVVSMPAALNAQQSAAAIALAESTVSQLVGVGVFAVEMFVTTEGELLINEIAPRVHNSGHLTLDACNISQFEQHVRAVVGMPLIEVRQHTPAAMLNILYTGALLPHCPEQPEQMTVAGVDASIYWYGKLPGKAGRKMGHINALAPTVELAVAQANKALATLSSGNSSDNSSGNSSKKSEDAA
jgi:5-(carboxyamino)imidazole ribonucleotide synthase